MWEFIAANWKWLMVLKSIEMFFCYRYYFGLIGEGQMEEEGLTGKMKNDECN